MFILKRTDQKGGYVSPAGSKNSYVMNHLLARRYRTLSEAEADMCPLNEIVVDLNEYSGPVPVAVWHGDF